ncbi:zinc ribbon domain-containing protein [Thalassoroseus pseudoceratinae]|uniref:zinc ribbon domain-containing protein n=1 Tax=Thalassoroseus pseudoceratinae TaxID=2713176 RepID=UPI00142076FE|nr:zinc ribbon domain-containing protein [Thalassoroseus pseudoceratinae]
MSRTVCPHCLARVVVRRDGKCPSCQQAIETETDFEDYEAEDYEVEDYEATDDELEDYEAEPATPSRRGQRSRRSRGRSGKSIECPACAELISSTHEFCPYCGENLDEGDSAGVWRDGNVLVFEKGARLPNRCIKSNEPAERFLSRDLVWAPPWVYLGLLGGAILVIVFYLIAKKTAHADFGITKEWVKRRRLRIATVWLLSFFGLFLIVAGAATEFWAILAAGVLTWIGALFYAAIAVPLYSVQRIDERYVWLKGINPEYLAELPSFHRR